MQQLLIFDENFLRTSFSFGILFRISRTIFNNLHFSRITFHFFFASLFFFVLNLARFLAFAETWVAHITQSSSCQSIIVIDFPFSWNWLIYKTTKYFQWNRAFFSNKCAFYFQKSPYWNHLLCLKKDKNFELFRAVLALRVWS